MLLNHGGNRFLSRRDRRKESVGDGGKSVSRRHSTDLACFVSPFGKYVLENSSAELVSSANIFDLQHRRSGICGSFGRGTGRGTDASTQLACLFKQRGRGEKGSN